MNNLSCSIDNVRMVLYMLKMYQLEKWQHKQILMKYLFLFMIKDRIKTRDSIYKFI